MRLPVALLRRKKTEMSTTCDSRNANIDEIWIRSALEKTRSNAGGLTPSQSGASARDHHGIDDAAMMISTARPTIQNAR
jgi:hypothetical protein